MSIQSLEEMADVIKGALDGQQIQFRGVGEDWRDVDARKCMWNFASFEYRVKLEDGQLERDWPHGTYRAMCLQCTHAFLAAPRRVYCRVCDTEILRRKMGAA